MGWGVFGGFSRWVGGFLGVLIGGLGGFGGFSRWVGGFWGF